MSFGCALVCIIFPPLAVIDKGLGSFLITTVLTFAGFYIAGIIAALIINSSK